MDDVEAIKQLKATYFRTLDTKDWRAFRDVFTTDFLSDTTSSGGKVIEGADEFVDYTRRMLSDNPTVHHGHTPEIILTSPDTATGIWALEDLVRLLGFLDMRGSGHYHEEYRKVDGRWCISYSKLTRLRMDMRLLFFWIKVPQFVLRKLSEKSG